MDNKSYKKQPITKLKGLLNFAGVQVEDFLPKDVPQKVGVGSGSNFLADIRSVISDNMDVISSSSRVDKYLGQPCQSDSERSVYCDDEKIWLLMKDMLDSWPDAIFFKNRSGELILVNEAHAFGMRSKFLDVIGKKDSDLFPEDEAELMHKDDEYVMTTGNPIVDKVEYITFGDGTRHYVSITKVPRRDERGNIIGLMGISRDVTGNLYQMLFATHKDCMFISTKDGKWFDINEEGAREMFGYESREDFLSHSRVKDVYLNPKDRAKYVREIEKKGSVRGLEMRFRKKDNTPIDVKITATVIVKDGKVWGYHGTIRDITIERRTQNEEKKRIKKLGKTVSKLRKFILLGLSSGLKLFSETEDGNAMAGLTVKQKELFPLFILGKTDQDIAQMTNLKESEVAGYRYEIYKNQ